MSVITWILLCVERDVVESTPFDLIHILFIARYIREAQGVKSNYLRVKPENTVGSIWKIDTSVRFSGVPNLGPSSHLATAPSKATPTAAKYAVIGITRDAGKLVRFLRKNNQAVENQLAKSTAVDNLVSKIDVRIDAIYRS